MIPIANFEQRYALTEDGQIFNLANNLPLAPIENPNGYLKVGLANGKGGHKQLSIHRLVALHCIPNPYGYTQVNHKNGNKHDNRKVNLEWCNVKQNINHALETGLRKGYMSANDKEALIQRVLAGEYIRTLAAEVGRREASLSGMLRRRAADIGLTIEWQAEMRRRRSESTTLRNKARARN